MPCSENITIPYVQEIVRGCSPKSVLDIGIGMGKFGFIYREVCEWARVFETGSISSIKKEDWDTRLDGIEVCAEYITPLQKYLYDTITIGPVQNLVTKLGDYDMIYMGDVIEHLEKSEGQELLDTLFEKSHQGILIVTPVGEYEQEGFMGNPYEEHKSVWAPADFCRFPCLWSRKVGNRQWIIFISRKTYWFRDPTAERKTQNQLLKINARHQKLKKVCKSLLGGKGLNFLLKIKQRHDGWKTNG